MAAVHERWKVIDTYIHMYGLFKCSLLLALLVDCFYKELYYSSLCIVIA